LKDGGDKLAFVSCAFLGLRLGFAADRGRQLRFSCSVFQSAVAIDKTMPNDGELLRRYAANGDQAAFAEVVRRHLDGVFAAALRRVGGDVQFAEDVAQQVFVALARKAASVAEIPCVGAWLHTTTRHEAANVVRRERRRKARELRAQVMNELENNTVATDWKRIAPMLDAAIDQLTESDRAAIVLRFIERRGFAEIGGMLQVSADAARMRVERALDKLRDRLRSRGVTSTAMALGLALTAHAAPPAPVALAASVMGTALAGAAVATGVSPWLAFMSLTKVQTGIAATLLLAAGVAFHSRRVAEAEHTRQSAADTALTSAMTRLAELQRESREAAARRAELERQVAQARAAQAGVRTNAPPAGDAQLEIIRQQARARQMLARTHPEYQRLSREVARRDLRRQYGPLYQTLGLSETEVAQFEKAMVDHDWQRVDVESAARAQGVLDSDPAIARWLAEIDERRNAALREVWGAERHARYQQYRYSEGIRSEITGWMAGALYQTPTPLTGPQANQLTEILTRHTTPDEENRADRQGIRWDAALGGARDVLHPAQMEFLQSMRTQMTWRKAFYEAIGSIEEKPAAKKPTGG
jgi:RNA polymerase sigma factor (sigma-70 family)